MTYCNRSEMPERGFSIFVRYARNHRLIEWTEEKKVITKAINYVVIGPSIHSRAMKFRYKQHRNIFDLVKQAFKILVIRGHF